MTIRRIMLLSIMCLCLSQVLATPYTDIEYSSRKVRQLVEALHLDNLPKKDSLIIVPHILRGKSITIQYNESGFLSHAGISLFSRETKRIAGQQYCDFIERFFLELCEQQESEGVMSKLVEYTVTLNLDGIEYGNGTFRSLRKVLEEIDMPASFSLHLEDNQGRGVWQYGAHVLTLSFPLYRELIEGTDKQESDELLYIKISESKTASMHDDETLKSGVGLKHYIKDIYVKTGVRYQLQALSSDVYYRKQGDSYIPLFATDYPVLSLNNLFLIHSNGMNVNLKITHRQYGHFTPEITVPLQVFMDIFSEDFTCFAHTGELEDGTLESIVVFNHKTLNYIHMLRVKTTAKDVFMSKLALKADFITNIPQHYLKTLLK